MFGVTVTSGGWGWRISTASLGAVLVSMFTAAGTPRASTRGSVRRIFNRPRAKPMSAIDRGRKQPNEYGSDGDRDQ